MGWPWRKTRNIPPNYFERSSLGYQHLEGNAVPWEHAVANREFVRQRFASAWMWVYPVIVPSTHIMTGHMLSEEIDDFLHNKRHKVFWTSARVGWIIRFYEHRHAILFNILFA